jgi:methyl-accepting chemotaxis protein
VAAEVRTLAQRAAEAARTTGTQIEDSVTRIEAAGGLVTRSREVFADVTERARGVGTLVDGIAESARQQADGILKVSTTLRDIERIVHENADHAKTAAEAADEMRDGSQATAGAVGGLAAVVSSAAAPAAGSGARVEHLHVEPVRRLSA